MPEESSLMDVHYIRNNDFRTVYSTGIFGGALIGPNGGVIDMNFITDRVPIPNKISYEVQTGLEPKEVNKESKSGFVREVHFGVILDIPTAKKIVEWLNEQITFIENQ